MSMNVNTANDICRVFKSVLERAQLRAFGRKSQMSAIYKDIDWSVPEIMPVQNTWPKIEKAESMLRQR